MTNASGPTSRTHLYDQNGLVIAFLCALFGIFIGACWSALIGYLHSKSQLDPSLITLGSVTVSAESLFICGSSIFIVAWIFHLVDVYMKLAVLSTRNLPSELLPRFWKKTLYFLTLLALIFGVPMFLGASPSFLVHSVILLLGWIISTTYCLFLVFDENREIAL